MIWPRRVQLYAIMSLLVLLVTPTVAADVAHGIVGTPPPDGPFVKVDQGYMVPYKSRIPGTKVEFEMVPVPGGKFKLGSPAGERDRKAHEGPQLEVSVKPFWIGRYEVTWGEYQNYYDLRLIFRKFDEAGIRKVTKDNRADAVTAPSFIYYPQGRLPAVKDKRTKPKYPAVSMTQYAAKQYTKWLSKLTGEFYRLPSEVEWEYACRATSTTAFHFGGDAKKLGDYAWHYENSNETTHPVGQKKPNRWGLYDMHGNAGEWVLDQFDKRGYPALSKAIAADKPAINWPKQLYPRVVRGGSWDSDPHQCRSASRLGSSDEWKDEEATLPQSPWWLASSGLQSQIGFRIIRPLAPPVAKQRTNYWDADVKQIREEIQGGRGEIGLVDPKLPAAIKRMAKDKKER